MVSIEESPDMVLHRLSRQMEDMIRSIGELVNRQTATDNQVSSLLSQRTPEGNTAGIGTQSVFRDDPIGDPMVYCGPPLIQDGRPFGIESCI